MTTPLRPTIKPAAVQQPKPTAKPVAAKAKTLVRDELSTGKGQTLRASAEKVLGARPFSAQLATAATAATLRVDAFGNTIKASATSATQPATQAVQDQARDILNHSNANPTVLADILKGASDDPALSNEIIRQIATGDNAAQWFGGQLLSDSRKGQTNEGYDELGVIGSAVAQAYKAGQVTDADLGHIAEQLGPDDTAKLVQALALGQGATDPGGVVEALGEQAEALGMPEAAALAFTSNQYLISAHYKTDAAQKEAFGHLKDFVERYDQDGDYLAADPNLRNAVGSALTNIARLTANGNGYTEQELDDEVKELGPGLVGEAIAQAAERPFNDGATGPLDVLGDAALRQSKSTDGDKSTEWNVNASIAYTASTYLMAHNIGGPGQPSVEDTFKTLNQYLADNRGEWSLAATDGYSLVRLPQAVEGLNLLLNRNPELISTMLDKGPEGQADLVQLFESIALNPDVSKQQRDMLQYTVDSYMKTQLGSVKPGLNDDVGQRIGQLFGCIQIAADRTVASGQAPDDKVKGLALDLVAGITGAVVEAGLEGTTGPLGAAIGGEVVSSVLGSLFEGEPPTAAELEEAVQKKLEAAGIKVHAGELGHETVKELYTDLHQALTAQLAGTTDPRVRQQIENQIEVVQGVINGLTDYGDSINSSSEAAGGINDALDDRHDKP